MNEKKEKTLKDVIKHTLIPVRDTPLNLIIETLTDKKVISIEMSDRKDKELLDNINKGIFSCGKELKDNPIKRNRPNEVGNDVKGFVKKHLKSVGFTVKAPLTVDGKKKATGYPDILIYDKYERPTYIECKTYSKKTKKSSMRSFYFSPSEDSKVSLDARHLVLSFEMYKADNGYYPKHYKLVDVSTLLCDLKYEFNSKNTRLYNDNIVMAQGEI